MNKYNFKEIAIGNLFSREQIITQELINRFAELSGDYNPLHLDENFARSKGFAQPISYGNILSMLLSALVGMELWSQQVMIISEKIDFRSPVYVGDTIRLDACISQISEAVNIVELKLIFVSVKSNITVATGKVQVRCI